MNQPTTIIFDLDQTLAESKSPLTATMATLLATLMLRKKVAIISGGALPQFILQVVDRLPKDAALQNLYLMPTSGAELDTFDGKSWQNVYAERLTDDEVQTISAVIRDAARETGIIDFDTQSWGERIENRGAQVSVSALGQQAPIAAKKAWDPEHTKRKALVDYMAPRLPGFSVKFGGATTIDITRQGVDKAFGIRKLSEFIHEPISAMLYIGDELSPGGNDEIVKQTDIATRQVDNPLDTQKVIEELLRS